MMGMMIFRTVKPYPLSLAGVALVLVGVLLNLACVADADSRPVMTIHSADPTAVAEAATLNPRFRIETVNAPATRAHRREYVSSMPGNIPSEVYPAFDMAADYYYTSTLVDTAQREAEEKRNGAKWPNRPFVVEGEAERVGVVFHERITDAGVVRAGVNKELYRVEFEVPGGHYFGLLGYVRRVGDGYPARSHVTLLCMDLEVTSVLVTFGECWDLKTAGIVE